MKNQSAGNVFLVTAPSGAGKSSLVNALLEKDPGIELSISCTTRAPREGETDGRDYFFVDEPAFKELRDTDQLLEWAHVHGNYYGTPRAPLAKALQIGRDVLLEIDWQGANQVRKMLPGVTGVFILPPSLDALESRLRGRGKDSEEVIANRLAGANAEISHAHEFEYVIINQDFSVALAQLQEIVSTARLRYARQAMMNPALFDSFNLPR